MNKKEEKLFDEDFKTVKTLPKYGNKRKYWKSFEVDGKSFKSSNDKFFPQKIVDWITEHDKRERERLIHNILCNISQEDLLRKIFEKRSIPERELSQADIGVRRSFEMNLHNFIDSCGTVLSYVNEIINKYK